MPIRLLLLLAAAAVEAIPLALVAGLMVAWSLTPGAAPLPLAAVAAAVLLAYGATRLALRRRLPERPARLLLAGAGLAVAAALYAPGATAGRGLPALRDAGLAALTLAILLLAWSRGVVLARENLMFDAIYAAFRRGLIVVFVTLVLAVNTAGAAARGVIHGGWGDVIVFFLAALCALSLARVEEERRRGAGPEGPPPVRGAWLLTLLVVAGGVLLIGLALSSLLSPLATALALAPLGRLLDLLQWLLTPLILLLAALLDPLMRLLGALLHRHAIRPPAEPRGKTKTPDLRHLVGDHATSTEAAHVLLVVIAVVGVGLALWYAFSVRGRSPSDEAATEERESLWSWALLLAGLRALWRRLRRHGTAAVTEGLKTPPVSSDSPGTLSIRAIYRALLLRAAGLGLPRQGTETPHEYLSRLRSAVPASEKDAALLTALYARARYGPGDPEEGDISTARQVWARLEAAMQRPAETGRHERP